ncbi:hypothetical protein B2J86_05725 [Acidovorax sp. SRB_14]|uniref:hypothetical protein n=1 Tax=unclassified Acidovorax TaxID=2684926 RepID=UPI00145CF037|nr:MULTISPECIES: hypothetical protein [unclassified Acidovorax]NMM78879.1 hypothetical protein [Acidovorax sp. SRB_24]NMM80431.1 hypothetical protein [Acidovorax sp. SRB_14]NMM92019.1 hypothetical protein [Rhodococcus sp. SRB_17]
MTARWNYPTLLRTPARKGEGGFPKQTLLPLEPQAYAITQQGETWRVAVKHTGEVIYAGPGPVQLVASPAPF